MAEWTVHLMQCVFFMSRVMWWHAFECWGENPKLMPLPELQEAATQLRSFENHLDPLFFFFWHFLFLHFFNFHRGFGICWLWPRFCLLGKSTEFGWLGFQQLSDGSSEQKDAKSAAQEKNCFELFNVAVARKGACKVVLFFIIAWYSVTKWTVFTQTRNLMCQHSTCLIEPFTTCWHCSWCLISR